MRWTLIRKFLVLIGAMLTILTIGVAVLTYLQVRQHALTELEKKGVALADTLNYTFEVLLSQESAASLQRVAENSSTVADVRSIVIAGRDKVVLASNNYTNVSTTSTDTVLQEYIDRGVWKRQTLVSDSNQMSIIQPLRGGQFSGGANGDIAGAVLVTLDTNAAEQAAMSATMRLLLISLGGYVLFCVVLAVTLRTLIVQPVQQLANVAERFRGGERTLRAQLRRNGDEIGVLATTFDEMADEITASLASLEDKVTQRTQDLEQQRAHLETALTELRDSSAERQALSDTIREMSTPVIKLHDQILIMPLIGSIDSARAQQITTALLRGIEQHAARKVILDITGVAVVDTQVAAALLNAVHSVRLLGAQAIIVGIAPEVAQSIVHLGLDMSSISFRADLQSGLREALGTLGLAIETRLREPHGANRLN